MLSSVISLVLALIVLGVYRWILYPTLFSPLSKIPRAHAISSISSAWILWKRYMGQENRAVLAAHQEHGEVVRLGPNELSINCMENGIKRVYGDFEKTRWWTDIFTNYGEPSMAAFMYKGPHATRRRMLNHKFSNSYLQSSVDFHKVLTFVLISSTNFISNAVLRGNPVDVYALGVAAGLDFCSGYFFGLQNGTDYVSDTRDQARWLHLSIVSDAGSFWSGHLPRVTALLEWIGIKPWSATIERARKDLRTWVSDICENAANAQSQPNESAEKPAVADDSQPSVSNPVLFDTLMHGIPALESSARLKEKIAAEMLDQLTAGSVTIGLVLTYCIYELSRDPTLQRAVHEECMAFKSTLGCESSRWPITPSSLGALDALPLLDACVKETLRLYVPIPGPLARRTPQAGCSLGEFDHIPGDVRVSAYAYVLHRNEKVFEQPNEWRPKRWIDAGETQKREMLNWFWAYGTGTYQCSGLHMARHCMKAFIATVYSSFVTTVIDDEGIEPTDALAGLPTGGKLIIQYARAT